MESESHRLIHSLTAHLALYHSRLSNSRPSPAHRDSILRWFSSLSSAHRQAAVSVADSSFVQIVLQMHSRLRRQGHLHFLLLPDIPSSTHPFLPSLSFRLSRGLLSRSAASNSSAMLLSNSLLFFSSTSSGAASADALTVSESMVTDVDHFVDVMDGISGGRFLCEVVEMTGLTAQWAELPWLKDMGYYSLESFLANRLEVALRLSWLSSQGGKKPKEKRLKERASEVAGKAANAFWRMKGCLGWWVGLDPDVHKVFISAFLGKAAKTLASQIIKEEDAALETRFDILDTGRNVKIKYSELSSWKKPKRSLLLRDADFGFDLDFFPSRVPNNLATIWNKLIVVQDISDMLLAWQSSNGEAEKLFFGSLSSVSTISDLITKKLQRFLMAVHYNLINYELMDDKIYTGRKAEEKSTSQYRKEKSKSYSSKKSNAILKTYNTTMSLESTKKLDGGTDLCNKESASVLVAHRILDGVVSLAVNNVPEVEALATQEEMVATKNLIRKPYINWAVKRVTRSLQVLWPRSRTSIFGSNATGLALPTSDVDVVVSLPPVRNLEPIKEAGILEGRNGIKETCLQHATRYLANQEWVRNDSLKTIENTAIPLIVLVAEVPSDIILSHGPSSFVDISKEKSSNISGEHYGVNSLLNVSGLENGITSKTSKSTKDDAVVGSKSVHLDISFKSTSHTGLQTSELVRELTQQFPASVPLALVLKKFLADRSLDHSYSGGLSSYCLVLLITRFLQHEHHCGHSMRQNLGSLLMDFFYFFGNVFDPRHMRISIQGSGVYMKRERALTQFILTTPCFQPIMLAEIALEYISALRLLQMHSPHWKTS